MRIKLTSVFVDNQDEALKFYTEILGFVKKLDFPIGEFKWLTVVSPQEPDGTQLLLEPSENSATKAFKKSVFEQGISVASFQVDDIQKEYIRMKKLGVEFTMEPTNMGMTNMAIFNDTCGNLIQIYEVTATK